MGVVCLKTLRQQAALKEVALTKAGASNTLYHAIEHNAKTIAEG